ncbi:MAG: type II toxin-antitoxin system CcdA family antitoxin [Lachnospiraceae bacterium]|nr:type II toxin-antitoxin system CcdA family antitoxin [Lachnospiraceae bacterium]
MPKLTKEKTCTIGVRVSEELKEELLKMAKEQNRNLSNTVETILKEYVEKKKKPQNEVFNMIFNQNNNE